MLKLKKIHILGFKIFCDRTELTVPGTGVAVVVGPNGCGKSNILDGVTWVLGEQSAKTLRGTHMQDVIFAGTRDRKAQGMAEVTLTMVDPEAYEGPVAVEPEVVVDSDGPTDWDENELRRRRAAEAEEIIAAEQPGVAIEDESADAPAAVAAESSAGESEPQAIHGEGPQAVVLKIRRRKFHYAPQRGEVVITRRLFRTGESEYLLNGKLCRLRDIQDIFMGTGLGPESYAIIGQERIGQLLSSKPYERRAIVEEAAGVTRFKTRKRLSELRLESAKQNLARVDDIFEEVTRQMNSLKRQAAKAERYAAVRDEMRSRLRVVLASRITQMDAEQAALMVEIAELGTKIEQGSEQVSALDEEHSQGMTRGYELDASAKDANARANQSSVELERATTREIANQERIAELRTRAAAGSAELEQARLHLQGLIVERGSHRSFLENAAAEAAGVREDSRRLQTQAREASEAVGGAEQRLEAARRYAMQLLTQAGHARNQTMHAEESLTALEQDAERLASEISAASTELASLGQERGQASLKFESVTEQLQRLEGELVTLRAETETRRSEESAAKLEGDRLRAEMATLTGRRNSLQSLIREHSYSTDTVRKLLKSNSLGGGLAPVGTLADFLEVSGEYETVVDAFLRDELNYIVVKSWESAHEGMRLLKSDVDGRATFLVHPDDSQAKFSFAGDTLESQHSGSGVKRLKDCIRVLDGFGRSLEVILPKLREGFVTPNADVAKTLALENPNAFFLAPSGECFHNVPVTGGKPSVEGPLALKGELRETQKRLDVVEAELAAAEIKAAALARLLNELSVHSEQISEERRTAEGGGANKTAALRQMEAEVARLERRLDDWIVQSERNKDLRNVRQALIEEKREETARLEADHETAEIKVN